MELNEFLIEIDKVCLVEQERMKQKQRNGDYFNVFNMLGLWSDEIRLHSAFLAELLNPNGSHGLKDALLKEFLAAIGLNKDYISNCKTNIVERYIGERTESTGGRIDIILEDGEHAVIIENKIYAIDQHHQLLRYNNYGKQHFPKGFKLIYLTLDGHEASKDSLGDEEIDYHCISYDEHILYWLSQCVMLAYDKPLARETISQYITLIKQITGQDMNKDSSDKIVDLAINNMEAVVALMDNRAEISSKLRTEFIFKPLKEFAVKMGMEFKLIKEGDESPALKFKMPQWSHYIVITRDDGRDSDWKNLYIGISQSSLLGAKELPIRQLSCFSECSNTYWPYGWEWILYTDWHSTSSYLPIRTGEVSNWIISKIRQIIEEIEDKGLPV